eukprot:2290690-Rhodomonas_salina.1
MLLDSDAMTMCADYPTSSTHGSQTDASCLSCSAADLMRAAVAAPGNDFRLGAMEAPPAIISTYLGETLTEFLDTWRQGQKAEYKPKKLTVETGCDDIDAFQVPTEDRNRTSPF